MNKSDELRKQLDEILDSHEREIRKDISNHVSGDKSRNSAFTHIDARKQLEQLLQSQTLEARIDEAQKDRRAVSYNGEASHVVVWSSEQRKYIENYERIDELNNQKKGIS